MFPFPFFAYKTQSHTSLSSPAGQSCRLDQPKRPLLLLSSFSFLNIGSLNVPVLWPSLILWVLICFMGWFSFRCFLTLHQSSSRSKQGFPEWSGPHWGWVFILWLLLTEHLELFSGKSLGFGKKTSLPTHCPCPLTGNPVRVLQLLDVFQMSRSSARPLLSPPYQINLERKSLLQRIQLMLENSI